MNTIMTMVAESVQDAIKREFERRLRGKTIDVLVQPVVIDHVNVHVLLMLRDRVVNLGSACASVAGTTDEIVQRLLKRLVPIVRDSIRAYARMK